MKQLFIIMLIFMSVKTSAQSEEAGILKAVNDFLDGGTNGNVSQFQEAFVADAVQRSIGRNGNVIGMTVESLASKLKPGQTMDRQTRIISWSYAGISAVATTETIYPTSKIVDYLNLLKIGDDWKIVTRVYSRIESDESITTSTGISSTAVSKPASTPAPKKKKPEVVIDDGW